MDNILIGLEHILVNMAITAAGAILGCFIGFSLSKYLYKIKWIKDLL